MRTSQKRVRLFHIMGDSRRTIWVISRSSCITVEKPQIPAGLLSWIVLRYAQGLPAFRGIVENKFTFHTRGSWKAKPEKTKAKGRIYVAD